MHLFIMNVVTIHTLVFIGVRFLIIACNRIAYQYKSNRTTNDRAPAMPSLIARTQPDLVGIKGLSRGRNERTAFLHLGYGYNFMSLRLAQLFDAV